MTNKTNYEHTVHLTPTRTTTMPFKVKDNLVEELIDIVKFLKASRDRVRETPSTQNEMHEILDDLDLKLCNLMTSMISSPLTGRILMPTPASYVTQDQIQEGIRSQMGLD